MSRTLRALWAVGVWLLFLTVLGLLAVAPARSQPKPTERKEEVDDAPKTRTQKPVPQVVGEDEPKETSRGGTDDLKEAVKQTKNEFVRNFFKQLAEPKDEVFLARASRSRFFAEPIPYYLADGVAGFPDRLRSVQITEIRNGKRQTPREYPIAFVDKVIPYEQLALEAVRDFLGQRFPVAETTKYLSRAAQYQAAEEALKFVIRFHESERLTSRRLGEGFDALEQGLRKRLLNVMGEQLGLLVEAKDFDGAVTMMDHLLETYRNESDQKALDEPMDKLLQQVFSNQIAFDADRTRAMRQRLRELAQKYPDSAATLPIKQKLQAQAEDLFNSAKKWQKDQPQTAAELIQAAREIYPELPGLRELDSELSRDHKTLRVGVRHAPHYLSPAMATTDAEKQAVELLFESLLKLSCDPAGVPRYDLGLAEARPQIIESGRSFMLPRDAYFSNNTPVTAFSVRESVQKLRLGSMATGLSPVWGELLAEVVLTGGPYRADVRLTRGFLNPLSPMTFKIVPKNPDPCTKEFAQHPVGSGPYRLDGARSEEGGDRRHYIRFVPNPGYTRRTMAADRPYIQEIQFYQTENPLKDLAAGKLDVALNLRADQYREWRQQAAAENVKLHPGVAGSNRRVYFLAVNHRDRHLGKANVRRAVAHAINREKLLDDFFRAGLSAAEAHKALNSPYPAGSWPCDPSLTNKNVKNQAGIDPYDRPLAKAMADTQPGLRGVHLHLKYPNNDPDVEKAMQALRAQVADALGFDLLLPEATDPLDLREAVEKTYDFELAYYHYDFPDDTLWLMPLLGPNNPFGYQPADSLLEKIGEQREFSQVVQWAHGLHAQLFRDMPLIPLWQLDPFHAFSSAVKPTTYDPNFVFTNIEDWNVERP